MEGQKAFVQAAPRNLAEVDEDDAADIDRGVEQNCSHPPGDQIETAHGRAGTANRALAQHFKFVDVNDDRSVRSARSYVQRESKRRRRLKDPHGEGIGKPPVSWRKKHISRPETGRASRNPESQRQGSVARKVTPSDDLQPGDLEEADEEISFEQRQPQQVSAVEVGEQPTTRYLITPPASPYPVTFLSPNRVNPFASYPIALTRGEEDLVGHFISMPLTISSKPDQALMVKSSLTSFRDAIFKVGMHSPLEFQANIINFAAGHRSWSQGLQASPESMIVRAKTLALLNEAVHHPVTHSSDGNIMTVTALAAHEDRFGDKAISWMHRRAVSQMIRNRGGPIALSSSGYIPLLVNWMDYTMAGYQKAGLDSPFVGRHSYSAPLPSRCTNFASTTTPGIEEQCDDFVNMLRDLDHLSLIQKQPSNQTHAPYRHSVFTANTPLTRVLAPKAQFRIMKLARLAALFHIGAALWDYRSSPHLSERFLKLLDAKARELNLQSGDDSPTLVWIILQSNGDGESSRPERPWFVGQMLRIARRLSLESWERVNEMLLSHLVPDVGGNEGVDEELRAIPFWSWEKELTEEILRAPESMLLAPALVT